MSTHKNQNIGNNKADLFDNDLRHLPNLYLFEENNKNNIISIAGDIDLFTQFISTHPELVTPNILITNYKTSSFSVNIQYKQGRNNDNIPRDIHFILSCYNLPIGAKVSLKNNNTTRIPEIKSEFEITNSALQSFGTVASIPSNWKGEISYNYHSYRGSALPEWFIDFKVIYFVNPNHSAYNFASSAEELNIPVSLRDSIGPQKGIVLGGHRTVGQV